MCCSQQRCDWLVLLLHAGNAQYAGAAWIGAGLLCRHLAARIVGYLTALLKTVPAAAAAVCVCAV
jgi:hypothetical protein